MTVSINDSHDDGEMLHIRTAGTADFGIGGPTGHSISNLPVNR